METRQMTPFFSSTFSSLFVSFIFVFENNQNSFSGGRPFGPFWSVKCLNFERKLPIWTTHHTFLESTHPEVTKNSYYVLSPRRSQIPIFWAPAHGLSVVISTEKSLCFFLFKYCREIIGSSQPSMMELFCPIK